MNQILYISIILIILGTQKLYAQVEEIIIPSDLKHQTIITEPVTLRKGFLRAGISTNFIMIDRLFNDNMKKDYVLGTNSYGKTWSYLMGLQYGIIDRLQVSVRIPYANNQYFVSTRITYPSINYDTILSFKITGRGFSDLETGFRYQIVTESESFPSITLGVYGILPTGSKNPRNIKSDTEYDLPTGNGHVKLTADILLKKVYYPYSFTLYSYYYYNFKGEKVMFPNEDAIKFKNGGMIGVNAGFGLHLNDWIALLNDINVTRFTGNTYYYSQIVKSPGGWYLSYMPSVYFQIRKFRFFEFIQIPIIGKNSGADPVYSINLQYIF